MSIDTDSAEGRRVDPEDYGPAQAGVLEVLLEAGELRSEEIADRLERQSESSIVNALSKLKHHGAVESRQVDPRGWCAYRVAGTEPTVESREYGPLQAKAIAALEQFEPDEWLLAAEVVDRIDDVSHSGSIRKALLRLVESGDVVARERNPIGWREYRLAENGAGRE